MSQDDAETFLIQFEELSAAEANVEAAGLREWLLDSSPDARVELKKDDTTTMDMGATLVLVLGTPAVIAVAKGIQAYLARGRRGKLVIKCPDGKRVVFDGDSSDAAKIAAALASKC